MGSLSMAPDYAASQISLPPGLARLGSALAPVASRAGPVLCQRPDLSAPYRRRHRLGLSGGSPPGSRSACPPPGTAPELRLRSGIKPARGSPW